MTANKKKKIKLGVSVHMSVTVCTGATEKILQFESKW